MFVLLTIVLYTLKHSSYTELPDDKVEYIGFVSKMSLSIPMCPDYSFAEPIFNKKYYLTCQIYVEECKLIVN